MTERISQQQPPVRQNGDAYWTAEHDATLLKFFAEGMSYSKIAAEVNYEHNTQFSRNAAIGRANRLGVRGTDRAPRQVKERAPRKYYPRARPPAKPKLPPLEPEVIAQRCTEITPRHLSLLALEPNDCRYPYGGDGEPFTFCGHPKIDGSSYCEPHFQLSRGLGTSSERAATKVSKIHLEAV